MERECSACGVSKTIEHFTPSDWKRPLHYTCNCRKCCNIARRVFRVPKKGFIYIIMNDAWPEWCKVGLTVISPEERLKGYQTGSPFRDYYVRYSKEVEDTNMAEAAIHATLKELGVDFQHEWFKVSPQVIMELL